MKTSRIAACVALVALAVTLIAADFADAGGRRGGGRQSAVGGGCFALDQTLDFGQAQHSRNRDLMGHLNKTQSPGSALLGRNGGDGRPTLGMFPQAQGTVTLYTTAGPHTPGQCQERHEPAEFGMAVRA